MVDKGGDEAKKIDNFIYKPKDKLGAGMFGTVYRGQDQRTGKVVAVKVIPGANLNDNQKLKLLKNEIMSLQKVSKECENIVRLYDVKRTTNNLYIITDFCDGGCLYDYEQKNGGHLSEAESIKIFKQILAGFKVLVRNNIVHRDMKPENILLHDGCVKIADFGFARTIDDKEKQENLIKSIVGSPLYMAPQILFHERYGPKCDIWSLGILFYEMLYGKTPFQASKIKDLMDAYQKKKPIQFPNDPPVSNQVKDVLSKMLIYDEANRIEWEDLFNNELFSDKQDEQVIEAIKGETDILKRSLAFNLYFTEKNEYIRNINDVKKINNNFSNDQSKAKSNTTTTQPESDLDLENTHDEKSHAHATDDEYDKKYEQQRKIKNEFKKYSNRILFDINLVNFLGGRVICKLYQLTNKIQLSPHLYFRTMYILGKLQISIIDKLADIMSNKRNDFMFALWDDYASSTEFNELKKTVLFNKEMYTNYFMEFQNRAKEFFENFNAKGNHNLQEQIDNIQILMKDTNPQPSFFENIFNSNLDELLKTIKPFILNTQVQDKELLVLTDYLIISKDLYRNFKLSDENEYDFSKFYESRQRADPTKLAKYILSMFDNLKIY